MDNNSQKVIMPKNIIDENLESSDDDISKQDNDGAKTQPQDEGNQSEEDFEDLEDLDED